MNALQELSNDPYNIVVVVTGLTKLKLGIMMIYLNLLMYIYILFLYMHFYI